MKYYDLCTHILYIEREGEKFNIAYDMYHTYKYICELSDRKPLLVLVGY